MNENIAKRFTEYRKTAGLSQGAVAEKLGVSRQAVSKWERGDAVPDVDNFVALAELYNVSFNTLYFGFEPEVPAAPAPVTEEKTEEAAATENVVTETVEEAAEEIAEAAEEVSDAVEEACDDAKEKITVKAKNTVNKIVKKIKTVKVTTEENPVIAEYLPDLPAAALALTALAASVKAKKKLPLVLFAAAIVPAWHAATKAIKNSKEAYEKCELCDDNDSFITEEIFDESDISDAE